jgi:hypothetical protein
VRRIELVKHPAEPVATALLKIVLGVILIISAAQCSATGTSAGVVAVPLRSAARLRPTGRPPCRIG